MSTKYKLDKSFGPVGTSAGIFIFLAGLIITYFSLTGLILIVIGAFVGFTSSYTIVDFDKKRIKFSTALFGILPFGQWTNIINDMKIGVKKSKKVWRAYSLSNRTLDIANNDFRIILYDSDGKEIMPILKAKNRDAAKLEKDKISHLLGIGII